MSFFFVAAGGYLLVGVLIVYVCMFADPTDPGVCGRANIFVTETFPLSVKCAARRVLGARVYGALASVFDWVCNKPNPLLQMFYLALILGGYGLAVLEAYPHIPNTYTPVWHKLGAAIGITLCLVSFFVACRVDPGTLTPKTWRRFDVYPYDDLMYEPNREYVGYSMPKLARSKHDRITGTCVARFDHYCAWLAQCVGERNYRYFLLFVFTHAVMLLYASALLFGILAHFVHVDRLFEARFVDQRTGQRMSASWAIVLQFLLFRHTSVCTLLVLCAVMCAVLFGFVGYHLWLIRNGTTTNESFKWAHILKCHRRMVKQHASVSAAIEAAEAEAEAYEKATGSGQSKGKGKDKDTAEAARARAAELREQHEELLALSESEMARPTNIYNKGFFANFAEVVFPLCDRQSNSGRGGGFATWPLPGREQSKNESNSKSKGADEDRADDVVGETESTADTKKER